MGYFAEETLSESFIGRASGVACDLVGSGEREEGILAASGDAALEGKVESALWPAWALVAEMSDRGYRHLSPLPKR